MPFEASMQQQEGQQPEITLLNWQGGEFCGVNQVDSSNLVYTRSKKRAVDLEQQTDKDVHILPRQQPLPSTG